ncbi:hypothetical protein [Streptomyces albicerus]|uniref:hypothetical protein n=1 Tax=Streptomyces albicerus TaxID=2569859 RepID=UPI00124B7255|nr:hypothetical protein [Streptomyces albicerus]
MSNHHTNLARPRRRSATLTTVTALTLVGGVQATGAPPADAAVPGLIRTTHPMTQLDSASSKARTPECPQGMKVVGGGGRVVGPAAGVIRLRTLRPVTTNGLSDRYEVVAVEPTGGVAGNWALEGYALCAPHDQLPGYEIVSQASRWSSVSRQETAAGCPSGKRVIGAGANILGGNYGEGRGLQMSRASGPLDITRAAAATDTASPANWQVVSHAICANPMGAVAESEVVHKRRDAIKECPGNERVHSVGGAAGDGPAGPLFLSDLYPSADLRATALRLTGIPADGLAVQAICS